MLDSPLRTCAVPGTQQMQWSPEGAHLLLQMRTRVLNGELEQMFRDWHPGFRVEGYEKLKMAA